MAAEVSGGADRGFYVETQSVWCQKCFVLQDVKVGEDKSESQYPPLVQHFTAVKPVCSLCSSQEVLPWQHGQPCPKCSDVVARSKEPIVLFD